MKIHEYQAKKILGDFGVPVPEGVVCSTVEEVSAAAARLTSGGTPVAVKAQIHAGGRGKGGGIKLAKDSGEAAEAASRILGSALVTPQTGPSGQLVGKVLVERGAQIAGELYAGLLLDRSSRMDVFMVSTEGGMEIEQVAAEAPEKIHKVYIDPVVGIKPFQARQLAYKLDLPAGAAKEAAKVFFSLYQAYHQRDASLAEINPLVITADGRVVALDAKMNFDDNALFRQPGVAAMRDPAEEDPLEREANEFGLNYIKLEGNVGCMVNGAGLAMATMDIIKQAGGEPANFLDVGGGANVESIGNGFRIICKDPNVGAVLINIFGGIVRCDRVARGVVEALESLDTEVPVVVRLQGTNAEEGKKIIEQAELGFQWADTFREAAEKAVAAASGGKGGGR
ncbi:MAG: ADP-forming succinate--CoA ligase subunit beta [Candidatus Glassbacteria bacterium]|nr:ADP-forming succinate--CoA ligase subunit beta [Candidatus Glassbacteria bacterium]